MTAVRPPTVGGVGGGVGVSTLAAALCGHDGGRTEVDGADIVACRGTLDSLRRAVAVLDHGGPGPRPVVAVTLDGARVPRGPLRAHLLLLEAAATAVVLLPHVRRWRTVADPLAEAATLLLDPPEHLARPLRLYITALRELAAAVAESGRLHVAVPDTPATVPGARSPRLGPTAAPARAGTPAVTSVVVRAAGSPRTPARDGAAAPAVRPGYRARHPAPPVVGSFQAPVDVAPGLPRRAATVPAHATTAPAHDGTARDAHAPLGTAHTGTAPGAPAQVGTAQVGTAQVGTAQVGTAQVGTAHVGAGQNGTAQNGIAQNGTARTPSAPRRGVRIVPAAPRAGRTHPDPAAGEAWRRPPVEQVG